MGSVDDALAAMPAPARGTIRFAADHPIPDEVLAEIVRLRLGEIT